MRYSSFKPGLIDALSQPMFLGQPINVARYDQQRHEIFEYLTDEQQGFFWRPNEISLVRDRMDFTEKMSETEKHIFIANLKYQTLLDSIQGRSPSTVLLPLTSLPELETWIQTWTFSETIHSRSYTHIIRNLYDNPSEILDDIPENKEIIKRANDIAIYYDELYTLGQLYNLYGEGKYNIEGKDYIVNKKTLYKALYLCMISINTLEAIRFYVSFACSFSFAERGLMEGNAKIIKLIARDESLHLTGTQHILNLMKNGSEGDIMSEVAEECEEEALELYVRAADQEKDWCDYLFEKGSVVGLNKEMLSSYIEYISNQRMSAIGFKPAYPQAADFNPLPWINGWLSNEKVQPAAQETEITSYRIDQIDSNVDLDELNDLF